MRNRSTDPTDPGDAAGLSVPEGYSLAKRYREESTFLAEKKVRQKRLFGNPDEAKLRSVSKGLTLWNRLNACAVQALCCQCVHPVSSGPLGFIQGIVRPLDHAFKRIIGT